MEVGTEEFPYTSKITITMYGALADPYIPIYGNKVIGVRFGTLDMHGVPRTPSWTYLAYSVKKGDTRIVMNTAVDWKAGEMIALASTSYDPHAAEKRIIKSVDNSNPAKPILTLTEPLQFDHSSSLYTYGTSG